MRNAMTAMSKRSTGEQCFSLRADSPSYECTSAEHSAYVGLHSLHPVELLSSPVVHELALSSSSFIVTGRCSPRQQERQYAL